MDVVFSEHSGSGGQVWVSVMRQQAGREGVIITPGQNNTVCSLKRGEIFTAKITHILSGFRDFDGVDGFYIV